MSAATVGRPGSTTDTAPDRSSLRVPRVGLTSPRSWAALVYVVIDFVLAIAFFVLVITLLAVGIGLAVIYVGVLVLVLALLIARFGGLVQRSAALALLDLPTEAPEWTRP